MVCQRCGLIDDFYTVPSGPHIKAMCNGCGRYIKFVKQHNKVSNPAPGNIGVTIYMMLTGSLCLTDLIEKAKSGHSAFSKGKNGKIYVNFVQWVNDDADQYGNHSSFNLGSSKEKREAELAANGGKKIYFGNAKVQEKGSANAAPVTTEDTASLDLGNLPF